MAAATMAIFDEPSNHSHTGIRPDARRDPAETKPDKVTAAINTARLMRIAPGERKRMGVRSLVSYLFVTTTCCTLNITTA